MGKRSIHVLVIHTVPLLSIIITFTYVYYYPIHSERVTFVLYQSSNSLSRKTMNFTFRLKEAGEIVIKTMSDYWIVGNLINENFLWLHNKNHRSRDWELREVRQMQDAD